MPRTATAIATLGIAASLACGNKAEPGSTGSAGALLDQVHTVGAPTISAR